MALARQTHRTFPAYPLREAGYQSWTPPQWPAGRCFNTCGARDDTQNVPDEQRSTRRPLRERPWPLEVVLAATTVLLWTTLLLMHARLSAATSRMIALGALLSLVATFVVSDRIHTAIRPSASLGRVLMLVVLSVVLAYVGYLLSMGWGYAGLDLLTASAQPGRSRIW